MRTNSRERVNTLKWTGVIENCLTRKQKEVQLSRTWGEEEGGRGDRDNLEWRKLAKWRWGDVSKKKKTHPIGWLSSRTWIAAFKNKKTNAKWNIWWHVSWKIWDLKKSSFWKLNSLSMFFIYIEMIRSVLRYDQIRWSEWLMATTWATRDGKCFVALFFLYSPFFFLLLWCSIVFAETILTTLKSGFASVTD